MARNLLGIILVMAAVGVAIFWTRPMWASVQGELAIKNSLEKSVERFQDLKKVRDNLLAKYNSISAEDQDRLIGFLPKSEEAGVLIVNIENLVIANKMALEQINVGVAESSKKGNSESGVSPGVQVMPVDLSVSGSYDSFRFFLEALDKNLRLLDIDSIAFSAGDAGLYNFSIKAVAYWQER